MSSKIFISCVTEEFGELRKRLRHYLTAAGCDVKTQEDFPQQDVDILEKLDAFIASCAAVIHIVGHQPGSTANTTAVARYLKPDILAGHQQLRETLGDFADLTYTQWEAFIAIHYHRPLRLYHLPNAQPNHLARLKPGLPQRYGSEFQDTADLFGQLIGDLRQIIPSIPSRFISNIPGSIGDNFKGREAFLTELHERLTQSGRPHTAAITAPQAVHGLGGIGKTRVAIEYAHRYAEHYTTRLFISADSPEALQRNFANLTAPDLLNLPEYDEPNELARASAVHRWLNTYPGWLLILDNVDTEAAATAVESLLPKLTSGHVLITSRLSNWSAQVSAYDLDVLKEEDAIAFLIHRTASKRALSSTDAEDVKILANKLDGLALALEQAAAYICEKRVSFAAYVRRFDERRADVLKWHNERTMQYPLSVATAWQTSFDQLTPAASALLQILSFLDASPIPASLIADSPLADAFSDALGELYNYSLAKADRRIDADLFSIHRLTQEVVRNQIEAAIAPDVWLSAIVMLDINSQTSTQHDSSWSHWQIIAPHCDRVLGYFPERYSGSKVSLLHKLGGYLRFRLGNLPGSEKVFRQALEISALSPEAENTRPHQLISDLAGCLQARGMYKEAESLYREALEQSSLLLGADDPQTLRSVCRMAINFQLQGMHAEAEQYYLLALEKQQALLAPEHQDTLSTRSNYGTLLDSTGQHSRAVEIFRSLLAIKQQKEGVESTSSITVENNLASALKNMGRLEEAHPHFQHAYEVTHRTFGPHHPHTIVGAINLASSLSRMGETSQAITLLESTIKDGAQVLGDNHPDVSNTRNNLGYALLRENNPTEAEKVLRIAFKSQRQNPGTNHPATLSTIANLAIALKHQGKFNQAAEFFALAVEASTAIFSANHPDVAMYLKALEDCRREAGK